MKVLKKPEFSKCDERANMFSHPAYYSSQRKDLKQSTSCEEGLTKSKEF